MIIPLTPPHPMAWFLPLPVRLPSSVSPSSACTAASSLPLAAFSPFTFASPWAHYESPNNYKLSLLGGVWHSSLLSYHLPLYIRTFLPSLPWFSYVMFHISQTYTCTSATLPGYSHAARRHMSTESWVLGREKNMMEAIGSLITLRKPTQDKWRAALTFSVVVTHHCLTKILY